MKSFKKGPIVISMFGYFLLGVALVMWLADLALYGASQLPIDVGYCAIALTGLVATMAAKQLKILEDRLDKIERRPSST